MKYYVDMLPKQPSIYKLEQTTGRGFVLDPVLVDSYTKARNKLLTLTEHLEDALDEQHYWG